MILNAPRERASEPVGILLSGGIDSGILLAHLLGKGYAVQPFYVQSGLTWEDAELVSLRRLLTRIARPPLRQLVVFSMPLADAYGSHWSTTGQAIPDLNTPDEAVYLPGRNILLTTKAAIWCREQGISTLALAVLKSNPFPDASNRFFDLLEATYSTALGGELSIWRPFSTLSKREVMRLGVDLPLELTFSCISPREGLHCGVCNKCAERRQAFPDAGLVDPTHYAAGPRSHNRERFKQNGLATR